MNLCIDIGNSSAKAAIFDGNKIVEKFVIRNSPFVIPDGVDKAILVSTRGAVEGFEGVMQLDHKTPVPLKNLYATPETLGCDRLAAAVGAHALYPDKTVLIVDFGTAITYDIVTAAGEFLGGNISPGAGSRFRALHDYTGSLPLLSLVDNRASKKLAVPPRGGEGALNCFANFPADNTTDAIVNGVAMGIAAETDRYIDEARKKFGAINVLFTGGDANYFAERTKNAIFVVSDLVFHGLDAILEYNAPR